MKRAVLVSALATAAAAILFRSPSAESPSAESPPVLQRWEDDGEQYGVVVQEAGQRFLIVAGRTRLPYNGESFFLLRSFDMMPEHLRPFAAAADFPVLARYVDDEMPTIDGLWRVVDGKQLWRAAAKRWRDRRGAGRLGARCAGERVGRLGPLIGYSRLSNPRLRR